MANLPFQMARGVAVLVGGVLLAAGVLLLGACALWLWSIGRLPADDLAGMFRLPLMLGALLGCATAGGGLFFLHRARDADPDEH